MTAVPTRTRFRRGGAMRRPRAQVMRHQAFKPATAPGSAGAPPLLPVRTMRTSHT